MKLNNSPIGIFDSGIGGTSIWKEISALLPFEDIIYLSDNKNAPYGEKSKQEIINLSVKNTEYLLKKKCKLIFSEYIKSDFEERYIIVEDQKYI